LGGKEKRLEKGTGPSDGTQRKRHAPEKGFERYKKTGEDWGGGKLESWKKSL